MCVCVCICCLSQVQMQIMISQKYSNLVLFMSQNMTWFYLQYNIVSFCRLSYWRMCLLIIKKKNPLVTKILLKNSRRQNFCRTTELISIQIQELWRSRSLAKIFFVIFGLEGWIIKTSINRISGCKKIIHRKKCLLWIISIEIYRQCIFCVCV